MKAWIENGRIRDICKGDPSSSYAAEVAANYSVEVPDNAENGDGWDGTTLTKPIQAAPEVISVVPPKVSPVEFMLLFTCTERVAIKAARGTDPVIDDFLDIIEDPRLTQVDLALGSTKGALDYFTALGILAAGRKAAILTGVIA